MDDQKAKTSLYQVITLFFLVAIILVVYSIFWGPIKSYSNSLWPVRTTSVSADAKVIVEPDIANFSFSIVSDGVDPLKLADLNNQKINKAISYIKEQGIDSKDIKTTGYNLSPKYNYDRLTGNSVIYGYTLTQTVSVKVRDLKNNLSKVPEILGGLPEMGINQISSISFEVDNPDSYLADARNEAFQRAKEKAKKIADANGLQLGRIMSASESGTPIPYYGMATGYGGAMDTAAKSITAPTIEPGSQELTINVSLTYELK